MRNVHQLVRKFACDKCDAKLGTKVGLRIHMENVHSRAVFHCERCEDGVFRRAERLEDHLQVHHQIDVKIVPKKKVGAL